MSIFNYSKLKRDQENYIIAEVGVNHECNIKIAKKLILLAKKGGAHAVKFQTYKANLLASKYSKAYWDTKKEKTKSQLDLFSKYDKFEKDDYKYLAKFFKKNKIDFLSTPFDLQSVDQLNDLVPAFKVSSSDITNIPLLRKISGKGKPILLSTGASNINEIKFAIKNLNYFKKNKIVLMHCILNYPTKNSEANLMMIKHLQKEFKNFIIGYSDHTEPDKEMLITSSAYLLGAKVIEKHFTHNKKLKGNDHYHSMDFKDLQQMMKNINFINRIIGKSLKKDFIKSEKVSRKNARRSIFLKKNVKKNEVLSEENLITLRPKLSLGAEKWDSIINKKASKDLFFGNKLNYKDIN